MTIYIRNFLLSLILLIYTYIQFIFLSTTPVGFDEAWHMFIFSQSDTGEFFFQLRQIAHPPVYFFINHLISYVSNTPETYRLVSLCCNLAGIIVLSRILQSLKLDTFSFASILIFFAFSINQTIIACSIRGYALMNFLVLLSFLFLLKNQLQHFLLSAFLAIFTHFAACFIYLSLALLALIKFQKVSRKVAIFLIFTSLCLAGYLQITDHKVAKLSYLKEHFYYTGNLIDFFLTNIKSLFEHLFPELLVLPLLLLILLWIRKNKDFKEYFIALPFITLIAIFIASLMQLYPFGGHMRHQYILVLPAITALGIALAKTENKIFNRLICIFLLSVQILNTYQIKANNIGNNDFWSPQNAPLITKYQACNKTLILNFYQLAANPQIIQKINFIHALNPRLREYKIEGDFCTNDIKLLLHLSYSAT